MCQEETRIPPHQDNAYYGLKEAKTTLLSQLIMNFELKNSNSDMKKNNI